MVKEDEREIERMMAEYEKRFGEPVPLMTAILLGGGIVEQIREALESGQPIQSPEENIVL